MKKITFGQLAEIMRAYNEEHPDREESADVAGVVIYKESNWKVPYSEVSRSYRVWNCNRAFQSGKISNSLSGDCLDGTDQGVRLDWYGWTPEYCYMEEK